MSEMIFFSKDIKKIDDSERDKLGIRGRRAIDLAEMGLPIAPGFVIDSELTKKLPDVNIKQVLKTNISKIEKEMKKTFGDPKNPLLLKVVLSSDLNVPFFPSIHNIGLNDETAEGFAKIAGKEFAYVEYCYLLQSIGSKVLDIDAKKFSISSVEDSQKKKPITVIEKNLASDKKVIGEEFIQDAYDQLIMILKGVAKKYCDSDIDVDNSLSITIQAMVYGNMGNNSYSGHYYTRNFISGESKIQGYFLKNAFDLSKQKPKDISTIEKKYYDKFTDIAKKVEKNFKEIRSIKFTIEEGNFWLVEQRDVNEKTTQATLCCLLDLHSQKIIGADYLVKNILPVQLNELLHPVIDTRSVKKFKSIKGGVSGSTGACFGRVYFSTEKILEMHRKDIRQGNKSNLILVMTSTYAEDVKAIEVSNGVVTCEGGFSSHAPVVARSLGKVAMVQPEMKMTGNTFTLGGTKIKEGDYISLNVPYHEEPTVYLGQVDLIEPNFDKNGLVEFLDVVQDYIDDFDVRANADQGREAELAKKFKAIGIGLCRTEHMFFEEKRIMKFREMIFAENEQQRRKALNALKPMQRSDFYDLFKIMQGKPVTIRLLDAPLHEFLPRSADAMNQFLKYMKTKHPKLKPEQIRAHCDELSEINPMLGHRGCRVAVTYPEIYEMQCKAIFEAACMLKKEGVDVKPEIMIPIVMSEQEIKFIKNGKKIEGFEVKGINDIKNEVLDEYGVDNLEFSIGSMIELPAAALRAGSIAQYSEFFSFGTNDLTQTTYGLSRDDINSFFPSYSLYDLSRANPFQILAPETKELIEIAAVRGRLTRPNIKLGLCGEHGADPENIEFCINAGLNYVSCSPYSIPIAKLAIAQHKLANVEEE